MSTQSTKVYLNAERHKERRFFADAIPTNWKTSVRLIMSLNASPSELLPPKYPVFFIFSRIMCLFFAQMPCDWNFLYLDVSGLFVSAACWEIESILRSSLWRHGECQRGKHNILLFPVSNLRKEYWRQAVTHRNALPLSSLMHSEYLTMYVCTLALTNGEHFYFPNIYFLSQLLFIWRYM